MRDGQERFTKSPTQFPEGPLLIALNRRAINAGHLRHYHTRRHPPRTSELSTQVLRTLLDCFTSAVLLQNKVSVTICPFLKYHFKIGYLTFD